TTYRQSTDPLWKSCAPLLGHIQAPRLAVSDPRARYESTEATSSCGRVTLGRQLRRHACKECLHRFAREHDNREYSKNRAGGKKEAFDTSHYQRKGITVAAGHT